MRGYAAIGLDNPKSAVNLGSVMRAAGVYGAALVAISGHRFPIGRMATTDTQKHHRHIPLIRVEDVLGLSLYDCVPVAVDLVPDAMPLPEYKHPERALYVFGAEDATLGSRILERCRDRVYVPTSGCMNLAACVNVVLYDRLAKSMRPGVEQREVET